MKLDDYLTELERLDVEATPGPWWSHEGVVTYGEIYHGVRKNTLCMVDHKPVAEYMFCSQDVVDGNAIATSRNALPVLLKGCRAALEWAEVCQCDELRETLQKIFNESETK